MNTVYRVVWNPTTCMWVVVSELAKGRKKSSTAGAGSAVLALAIAGVGLTSSADVAASYSGAAWLDMCGSGSYDGVSVDSSGRQFWNLAGQCDGYNAWFQLSSDISTGITGNSRDKVLELWGTYGVRVVSNAATASLRGDNGAWAVGLGHEESRNAVSVGYAKSIGGKSQISFGASFSGEDQSIGLGFGRAL